MGLRASSVALSRWSARLARAAGCNSSIAPRRTEERREVCAGMMGRGVIAYPAASGMRAAGSVSAHDRASRRISKPVPKILIVEDDFLAASEMEAVLMEAGFEIAGIANRAEDAVR